MRKGIVVLCGALVWLLTPAAFAHTVATDNSISATVHVSPNDSPVPGEVSTMLFEFKDPKKEFSVAACDCAVTILRDEKDIYTGKLGQNVSDVSAVHAEFSYTFPETGDYEVRVAGLPQDGARFEPFELEFPVRVGQTPSFAAQAKHHLAHFGAGGIFGGIVIGLIIFNYFKKAA